MSNRILGFQLFLESKEDEITREVKKIISEMFAVGKNINFSGKQDNGPEYVEFEVNESDYKLDYKGEDMALDYSEGVLKKREFKVSLKFNSKYQEGSKNDPVYKLKFKIKLEPTSDIKFDDKKSDEELVGWLFEDKPKDVIKFIKEEGKSCKWNDVTGVLTMKKSAYDNMDKEELKSLIKDAGGEKYRV